MKKNGFPVKGILIAFYAVLSVALFFMLVVSIEHPMNNLFPWQMAIGSVALAGVFLLFMKFKDKLPEVPAWVYITFLAVFGIGVLVVCLLHGNWYHFAGDYEVVYLSAIDIAEGREVSFPHYFETYGNNTVPMLYLATVIRIARMIGINEFYPLLALSIGTLLAAVWAVGYLLSVEGAKKLRLPAAVVMAVCLPVYVFSNTFYTDTMSFGIGITAAALLVLSHRAKKGGIVFAVLAAILTVWGANWKITCIIPLIALACVEVARGLSGAWRRARSEDTEKEEKKTGKLNRLVAANRTFLIYLAAILVLTGMTLCYVNQFPIYQQSKQKSNPVSAWIAMGMMNDGSYASNVEFSDTINALETKEEKSEYAKDTIKDHIGEAFSLKHIIAKTRRNFASGNFSANDYTVQDAHGSLFYNLLDPGGAHYWRASQYSFIYVFAIYIVMLYSGVRLIVNLIKKKDEDVWKIVSWPKLLADVAFFGLFIFLMLWEANNRQLYNALPVLILSLFAGRDTL